MQISTAAKEALAAKDYQKFLDNLTPLQANTLIAISCKSLPYDEIAKILFRDTIDIREGIAILQRDGILSCTEYRSLAIFTIEDRSLATFLNEQDLITKGFLTMEILSEAAIADIKAQIQVWTNLMKRYGVVEDEATDASNAIASQVFETIVSNAQFPE